MRFRKLRIAWSVSWGVVCALMVILWWRSCDYYDSLVYQFSTMAPQTCWCDGLLNVGFMKQIVAPKDGPLMVRTHPIARMERWQQQFQQKNTNGLGFGIVNNSFEFVLIMPFWLPLIVSGVCAALPWQWRTQRYQIRTLFFATAVVAIVLGLAAYAARK